MDAATAANDLFEQLTLDEKISLLSGKSMWTLTDIERVNLPSTRVSDGPQGVRKAVTDATAIESFPATCFPTACTISCSWNRGLVETIGKALAKECRQQGVHVLLGPGLNIKRHPCGGRNFEYFSEDPVVSGHMAAAMVSGIQSSGHIGACIKHVCVNNQESWRFRVNVLVDERTLREFYLQGFEYVIKKSQPWTLMCAYNQLNGTYCSENEWLFQQVVRKEWGFEGHVLTDWGATNRRAVGIEAGIDLEMPGTFGIHRSLIKAALKDGSLTQNRFDEAVLRNIKLIQRASKAEKNGDNTGDNKLPDQPEELYEQNHELAYQTALECVVLLQNEGNILPLPSHPGQSGSIKGDSSKKAISVALLGDFCKDPRYQGMGSSKVHSTKVDTILEHIIHYSDNFVFARGYNNADDDDDDKKLSENKRAKAENRRKEMIAEAVRGAKDKDAVIIMAGVPEINESEGFDREHLKLPAQHVALIEEVSKVNPNVIVVLSNGGPVVMPWKDKVKAIVECYLLGQAGARALLDILFGVATPSGKLTESFPLKLADVPSNKYFPGNSHTVEYREGLNVGYRYYDTIDLPVLFPFGHGLSYTSFGYKNCSCMAVTGAVDASDDTPLVQVKCTVTNEGNRPGAEVVQVYVHHDSKSSQISVYHPEHQLKEFAKTKTLKPGESEELTFELTAAAFSFFDIGLSEWILEEGAKYEIRLGSSSRDIRWTGNVANADISKSCHLKIAEPSRDARLSQPPLNTLKEGAAETGLSYPLVVNDADFRAMLDQDPKVLMHRSSRSLLGGHDMSSQNFSWRAALTLTPQGVSEEDQLPHDIPHLHRNSFLQEIEQSGCMGKMFVNIIIKQMEQEMEDPSDKKERKMIREVARNLPLRCLATFSRGMLSFELLDSLIALFNGQYRGAITNFSASASKSAKGMVIRR